MSAPAEPAQPLLSMRLYRLIEAYQQTTADTTVGSDSSFNRTLDSAALLLSSRLFMEPEVQRIVAELNATVFEKWGITFNNDRGNVCFLFPHLVVKEKQGSCVGMSLLYLLLAEKAGLPLHGVLAPSHLFVRYDNGTTQCNIETLRRGECMSNAWYVQRYSITDTTLYSLRNLTVSEVEAVVWYNLGTIAYNDGHYKRAVEFLRHAIVLMPGFPEAQGNLALAFEAQEETGKALAILISLRSRYPKLEHIDRNIAALQLKCGKYDEALLSYTAACKKYPDDPEAHFGRGVTLYYLERNDEAAVEFHMALALRPEYPEVREYLQKTKQ